MIDSGEVKVNYCALILAILSECSLETAFDLIECSFPKTPPKKGRAKINQDDILDMRKFREEGLYYHEIASYYGMTKDAVYARLNPRDKEQIVSATSLSG